MGLPADLLAGRNGQHVIGRYIADFVCLAARLVTDVDGDTHGSDEAELEDGKRTEEVERAGFHVIRFWNDYVLNDPDGEVAETILEALLSSALSPQEKARLMSYVHAPLPDPLR
jgi:very-short-patch-repair endonuclease